MSIFTDFIPAYYWLFTDFISVITYFTYFIKRGVVEKGSSNVSVSFIAGVGASKKSVKPVATPVKVGKKPVKSRLLLKNSKKKIGEKNE